MTGVFRLTVMFVPVVSLLLFAGFAKAQLADGTVSVYAPDVVAPVVTASTTIPGGTAVARADEPTSMDPPASAAESADANLPVPTDGLSARAIFELGDDGTAARLSAKQGDGLTRFKRNLRINWFNFASVNMENGNKGSGRFESYNFIGIDYRFSKNEKVSFRPAFLFNGAGVDYRGKFQAQEFKWSDAYFNYANYDLAWLPFDMDYTTNIRVYVPTSEDSQLRGMITRIRPYLIAEAPVARNLRFGIQWWPEYYVQGRTGYLNEKGYATGNRNYGYESLFDLEYTINRVFSVDAAVGHNQSWSHAVPVENVDVYRSEEVAVDASVGINWKALATSIGISQKHNVSKPRSEFSLFAEEETSYYARTYVRF